MYMDRDDVVSCSSNVVDVLMQRQLPEEGATMRDAPLREHGGAIGKPLEVARRGQVWRAAPWSAAVMAASTNWE